MVSGRTWGKAGVLGAIFALASGGWTVVPGASVSAADVVCAGSIQSCIDAAAPGDTVVIPAGVYNESVVLTGAVSLRGAGPTQTVIDATGLASRPLTIDGVVVDSTVVIEELTLTGGDVSAGAGCYPTPINCGGGLLVTGSAQPTLRDLVIEANRAWRGGGLYVSDGSPLVVERVDVLANVSVLTGGGIDSSSSLTLHDSDVSGNASEFSAGGGIAVELQPVVAPLPELVIEDSTVTGNTTGTLGGFSPDAGGVSAFGFDVTVRRTEISANTCLGDCDGGGMRVLSNFESATLTLDGVTVANNAAGEIGGGVWVAAEVSVDVAHSVFIGNDSGQGGGMAVSVRFDEMLSISNSVFFDNHAVAAGSTDGEGGGLFSSRCDGTFGELTFEANSAVTGGGLVCDLFPLDLVGASFVGNSATESGGGLYTGDGATAGLTNVQLTGNTAGIDGGGMSAGSGAGLFSVVATDNDADGSGGAVNVRSGPLTATMSSFSGNAAGGVAAFPSAGGGALFVAGGDVDVSDSSFDRNSAPDGFGGAVFGLGVVGLTDVVATANTSAAGGAVFARGNGVDLTRVTMAANTAIETGAGVGGSGGAVFASQPTDATNGVTVTDSVFDENSASGSFGGGGALSVSGELAIHDSDLTRNWASQSGGAVNSFGPTLVTGSRMDDNEARGGRGGGISAFVGFPEVMTVLGSTFGRNTALGDGGAINISGWIHFEDSTFEVNGSTEGRGGAVAASGLYEDVGGSYDLNTAGAEGGAIYSNSDLDLAGTTLSRNEAVGLGGGVSVNSSLSSTDSVFEANVAGSDGGGAYVGFRINGVERSTFDRNIAGGDGGGMWVERSGPIVDSSFSSNEAVGGGGGILAFAAGTSASLPLEVSASTIAGNTAGGHGGGILVVGTRPIDLTNVTVSGNSATGSGDGLAVTGDVAVGLRNVTLAGQPVAVAATAGTLTFGNVLVSGTCSQIGAAFVSAGGNLESTADTCGFTDGSDQVSVPAGPATIVGPLGDNGGPTMTHALPTGSPAVDAGLGPCPAADQRGVVRSDGSCDTGAYELVQATADAGGPYSVVEGATVALDGTGSSDDGGGGLTFAWSPVGQLDDPASATPVYTGLDDGVDVLTLTVTNAEGAADTDSATVTVTNADPIVTSFAGPAEPVRIGDLAEANAMFTDAGVLDTHTASVDWGDGHVTGATVGQGAGSGTVTATHVYTEPGVYALELTVVDDDGGIATSIFEFVVAYDGEDGFVTGGGWIDSPAGSCNFDAACAAAGGTAKFGFVSRYKRGASVPSGSTEFNFAAGGFNFHSNSYDWLVVNQNDANAQFKGTGTVNGDLAPSGEPYRFMIWAADEGAPEIDEFRIKIWFEDEATEVLVYDNGVSQPIGGGNITVHTGGGR